MSFQFISKSSVQRDATDAARQHAADAASVPAVDQGEVPIEKVLQNHGKYFRYTLAEAAANAATLGKRSFCLDFTEFVDHWVGLDRDPEFGTVIVQSLRNSGFTATYYYGRLTLMTAEFLEDPPEFLERNRLAAAPTAAPPTAAAADAVPKKSRLKKPKEVDSQPSSQATAVASAAPATASQTGASAAGGASQTNAAGVSAVSASSAGASAARVAGFFG
jgi:hypothetical protein